MNPKRLRALILGLIVLGILIAGFFGSRFLRAFWQFRGLNPAPPPAPESQPHESDVELIRDWMTVPYIAETYGVSPNFLFEALGIPPRGNEEKSLKQLNEEFSPESPGIVMEVIKAAIHAQQTVPAEDVRPAHTTPTATH